jgi:hypothetical protein
VLKLVCFVLRGRDEIYRLAAAPPTVSHEADYIEARGKVLELDSVAGSAERLAQRLSCGFPHLHLPKFKAAILRLRLYLASQLHGLAAVLCLLA